MCLSTVMRISCSVSCQRIEEWEGREWEEYTGPTTNWLKSSAFHCMEIDSNGWLADFCPSAVHSPNWQPHLVLSTCPLSGPFVLGLSVRPFEAQSDQLMCSLSAIWCHRLLFSVATNKVALSPSAPLALSTCQIRLAATDFEVRELAVLLLPLIHSFLISSKHVWL